MTTTRREFGFSLAALGAAISCEGNVSNFNPGLPPWHLWGATDDLELDLSGTGAASTGQQLVRVANKFPVTWQPWFSAEIVSGPVFAEDVTISVFFDVSFGVGRAMDQTEGRLQNTPSFRSFSWTIPGGTIPVGQPKRWANSGRQSSGIADEVTTVIDRLPAQDIQVGVRATAGTILPGAGVYLVRVLSFWAPLTHVRPDWFADGPQVTRFRGNETGGS